MRPRGKYTEFADEPDSTHNRVVDLVPLGARVLEFGCATGYMSAVLKQRNGCSVVGIEISSDAAELAREHCDRVIVGDAETLDYDSVLEGELFDAVVFADVLEHLREPGEVLRRIRPFLAEEGEMIASIPNVAHASLRLALLGGEFRYRETGLLDDTHLRFFTRETLQDLFEEAGYVITKWVRQRVGASETEIALPLHLPADVQEWLAADPEATTYQFVVRAVRSETASQLAASRRSLREATDELEEGRQELEELRRAHEVLQRQVIAERALLADHVQGLQHDAGLVRAENGHLKEEIEWRTDVMRRLEAEAKWRSDVMEQLGTEVAALEHSRSYRYTAPLRRTAGFLRRLLG